VTGSPTQTREERDGLSPADSRAEHTTVDLAVGMEPGYVAFFVAVLPLAVGAARRITGDLAAAEDAASEALAKAYLRWPKLRLVAYRDAWVLRVATNEALGMVRKQARREGILRRQPPASPVPDHAEESRQLLVGHIRRLPAQQRQVIALRFYADLPVDEVAAALGISSGAVKSHLHRAVLTLRQQLGTDVLLGEID
jgi:RNA polymerase sigma-70 factor (sigma-E family)